MRERIRKISIGECENGKKNGRGEEEQVQL